MMKLFEQMERINRLHELIRSRRTGTPRQLARRLGISESRLYQIIEELKNIDVPIEYCRQRASYYYSYSYEMRMTAILGPVEYCRQQEDGTVRPSLESGVFTKTSRTTKKL